MLGRREFSCKQLTTRLVTKGCAVDVATDVVAELAAQNLVSDERLIESVLRVRMAKGAGPLRIRQELKEKGISDSLISKWLDVNHWQWAEVINRVRQKKFGGESPKTQQQRGKQTRFLLSRGFTYDQIRQSFNPELFD